MQRLLLGFLTGGLLLALAGCGQPDITAPGDATPPPDPAATTPATPTTETPPIAPTAPLAPTATPTEAATAMPAATETPTAPLASLATATTAPATPTPVNTAVSLTLPSITPGAALTPTVVVELPTLPPGVGLIRDPAPPIALPPDGRVTGQAPLDLMTRIQNDLVTRFGVARSDIIEVVGEAVIWPDGSLGCPQPGVEYTMAEVNGYRVVLRAGDTLYDYRASQRFFVFCTSGPA